MSEKLYKAANPNGSANPNDAGEPNDGNVYNADYKVENDGDNK